jgi:hypothetical protein
MRKPVETPVSSPEMPRHGTIVFLLLSQDHHFDTVGLPENMLVDDGDDG